MQIPVKWLESIECSACFRHFLRNGKIRIVAAALLGSCTQDGSDGVAFARRDSAGVQIIEHELPSSGMAAQRNLSPTPVVAIEQDESDPEQVWTRIRSVQWLAKDRIGVLVSEPPYLRVYASNGRELFRLGNEGEGPGELRGPIWAGELEDSIVVRDAAGLSIYDEAGEYARSVPVTGENWHVLASRPGGWVTMTRVIQPHNHSQPPPPAQVMADWSAVVLTSSGLWTDTLAQFSQLLTWRVQSSLWGMLRHATSDGSRVHVLDSDQYEIATYADGVVDRLVRAPISSFQEFTEEHFAVTREVWGQVADRMINSDREAGRLVVPPAVSMLADDLGRLWIRRTDDGPVALERIWDIFNRQGEWTATLATPPEFSIQDIQGDRLLGIWTDEFDVTSVRVYAVAEGVD